MSKLLVRFFRDESGSEVIEYALMIGMLVIACLTIIGALSVKLVERWREIYDIL